MERCLPRFDPAARHRSMRRSQWRCSRPLRSMTAQHRRPRLQSLPMLFAAGSQHRQTTSPIPAPRRISPWLIEQKNQIPVRSQRMFQGSPALLCASADLPGARSARSPPAPQGRRPAARYRRHCPDLRALRKVRCRCRECCAPASRSLPRQVLSALPASAAPAADLCVARPTAPDNQAP